VRVQLTRAAMVASLALVGADRAALADLDTVRGGDASVRVYTDDDHVTVVTPQVRAATPIGRRFALDVGALVDVVSAASIDVTSAASRTTVHDQRVELDVGAEWAVTRTLSLRPRVVGSIENDYRSLHLGLGARVEALDKNLIVSLDYSGVLDQVLRAQDPYFLRPRSGHRLVAVVTVVAGRRTLIDAVLDGELVDGYQASPYRFVPIEDRGGGRLYSLAEATPDRRLRLAALARLRRALSDHWFFHADYRFYGDSWSILSHTASARLLAGYGRVVATAEARGYYQGAASFYRAHYVDDGSGPPAWRTRDRALGGVASVLGGLTLDVFVGRGLPADGPHAVLSVDAFHFWWLDFPLQRDRTAASITAGMATRF
jgi:hypothetical protein